MRRALAALFCLVLFSTARADDASRDEARRRNDALVKEGFNFTHGLSFGAEGATLELLVPPPVEEHELALWLAGDKAPLSLRVTGADGEIVTTWRAVRGEQRLVRTLAPGRYVVALGGGAGAALVGIKGPVIGRCTLPAERSTEHAADPRKGFHWPYLLIAPKTKPATVLLVLPNNSGFASDDVSLLRASAQCQARSDGALEMADRLGAAVLVPIFPRPAVAGEAENLYLHALSRAALETRVPRLVRVDLQLVAMIDDARARLGGGVGPRVLIEGFSAAGSFASRFAVLHPDRTLAAAVGSPGGWPIAPSRAAGLTYPIGLADAARLVGHEVDQAALRRVRFFFFLGGDDANDSVPYRDSFSAADAATITQRFGKTPLARWPAAQKLYQAAGLDATFKLYPGVGHMVTPAMRADVEAMFRAALATPRR